MKANDTVGNGAATIQVLSAAAGLPQQQGDVELQSTSAGTSSPAGTPGHKAGHKAAAEQKTDQELWSHYQPFKSVKVRPSACIEVHHIPFAGSP